MTDRTPYALRFADGGTLPLGDRTAVMGVLNVTPDSFSDGGRHHDPSHALRAAEAMAAAGATILDVGAESSRPGAAPVPAEEETRRLVPVIESIRRRLDLRLSVDTTKAEVAARALDAGADLINDVTALRDSNMLRVAARREAPVVLMHMRGEPRTMQWDTRYDNLPAEVTSFLTERVDACIAAGLDDGKILIDPGIGFGKSPAGSLTLLKELPTLQKVGRPVLVGASRKSFIGAALDLPVD